MGFKGCIPGPRHQGASEDLMLSERNARITLEEESTSTSGAQDKKWQALKYESVKITKEDSKIKKNIAVY